jgi:hypothetical protein
MIKDKKLLMRKIFIGTELDISKGKMDDHRP